MHPTIYRAFEQICVERKAGGAVLEIGAVPTRESLLCMRSLLSARCKIGVSLEGPSVYRDFLILRVNANDMSCFKSAAFDTVLCNATLEHDMHFWRTLDEICRVTRPGGLIVIGVPGYRKLPVERSLAAFSRAPLIGSLLSRCAGALFASTLTLSIHNRPCDFYRFSPQAVREVVMGNLLDVQIRSLLTPPRIIGSGVRP